MAREKLDKEINIIEMVKSWRYFEQAIKYLLPEKQRLDFKERARYMTINPDPDKAKEQSKSFAMMAKRTMSIRRHNFSDGFFSSEDEEVAKVAAKKKIDAGNDTDSDAGLPDGLRNTALGKDNLTPLASDIIRI